VLYVENESGAKLARPELFRLLEESRLFQGRRRVFERLGYSGFISPSQKPLRG